MKIAVPLESTPGEQRVALTPESVQRMVKGGHEIRIQAGAGSRAGFSDSAYTQAGATIAANTEQLYAGTDLVCRVQPPTAAEVGAMPEGVAIVSLLSPARNGELLKQLAARK